MDRTVKPVSCVSAAAKPWAFTAVLCNRNQNQKSAVGMFLFKKEKRWGKKISGYILALKI